MIFNHRMTPHEVMGFVENEKGHQVQVHEAMDQCTQEHLERPDDTVHVSQGSVPHALLAPQIDPVMTNEHSALERRELSGNNIVLLLRECHYWAEMPDKLLEALSSQPRKLESIQSTFSGVPSSSAAIRKKESESIQLINSISAERSCAAKAMDDLGVEGQT